MAYLRKEEPTCPNCGFKAPLTWVVDIGPNGGSGRASALTTDDWDVIKEDGNFHVMCKACGSLVVERSGRRK